jgi:hypothetical protein
MNHWKTDLIVTPSTPIRLEDSIVTLGSCFSDVIGNYLTTNKFKALSNPFGTVYNPVSIHQLIQLICRNESPSDTSYVESQGVWFHEQFHSSFFGNSKEELREKIDHQLSLAHSFLKGCRFLVLTYGTAFVYRRKDSGAVVANCHKQPSKLFEKELLSVDTLVQSAIETIALLRKWNPEIQLITTVSPVRHTKDTLPLNSVSKSILRLFTYELQKSGINYFPAYEIMMDDLRDYRFYKTDRIHPTEEAESYIIEKFVDQFFDIATKNLLLEWNNIRLALQHKPFQPASSAHQTFLQKTLERIERIRHSLPVEDEITAIKSQLL